MTTCCSYAVVFSPFCDVFTVPIMTYFGLWPQTPEQAEHTQLLYMLMLMAAQKHVKDSNTEEVHLVKTLRLFHLPAFLDSSGLCQTTFLFVTVIHIVFMCHHLTCWPPIGIWICTSAGSVVRIRTWTRLFCLSVYLGCYGSRADCHRWCQCQNFEGSSVLSEHICYFSFKKKW